LDSSKASKNNLMQLMSGMNKKKYSLLLRARAKAPSALFNLHKTNTFGGSECSFVIYFDFITSKKKRPSYLFCYFCCTKMSDTSSENEPREEDLQITL
jgi:hypothetical protein